MCILNISIDSALVKDSLKVADGSWSMRLDVLLHICVRLRLSARLELRETRKMGTAGAERWRAGIEDYNTV